jgi:hypothetical protein
VSTRDEDAAWQQIVDNYGDVPDLADLEPDDAPAPPASAAPETEPPEPFRLELYDEHFVPPPLPPPPVISVERRLAWVGLIASPILLVVFALVHYALPGPVTGLLVLAFLGSFGYLVATMEPHDPDDDGARV